MKVFIFTDIGERIGYGHVVRCSVLYDLLRMKGFDVSFVLSGDKKYYKIIGNRTHCFIDWHIKKNINELDLEGNCIAIIDTYDASGDIHDYIVTNSLITVFIDDNNRMMYPEGIILNPTVYGEEISYVRNIQKTLLLTGPKYVLLRKEFFGIKQWTLNADIATILVTLGGSAQTDRYNEIIRTIRQLGKNYQIDILCSDDSNIIVGGGGVCIHKNIGPKEVIDLMQECDLAISAGGQTLYELVSLGVPTIAYCIAENQRRNIDYFHKLGILKETKNLSEGLMKNIICLSSYSLRLEASIKSKALKLGSGLDEIVDIIGEKVGL